MQLRKTQILASMVLASSMILAPLAVNAASHHSHQQNSVHSTNAKYKKANFKRMAKLDLTQEQKDQMFKIRHDKQAEAYEQKKIIKTAKKQLWELASADKFDADKAKQAANDLGQAKGQLALLNAQSRADFRAVLTPEQKQKLADFKANKKGAKK